MMDAPSVDGMGWHEATEAERGTWRIARPRHDGEVHVLLVPVLALHRDYYVVDLSAQTRGLTLINVETSRVR